MNIIVLTAASAVSAIESVQADVLGSFDGGPVPQLTLADDTRFVVSFHLRLTHLIHLVQPDVFHSLDLLSRTTSLLPMSIGSRRSGGREGHSVSPMSLLLFPRQSSSASIDPHFRNFVRRFVTICAPKMKLGATASRFGSVFGLGNFQKKAYNASS